mgnify:CR=1 FL=1
MTAQSRDKKKVMNGEKEDDSAQQDDSPRVNKRVTGKKTVRGRGDK